MSEIYDAAIEIREELRGIAAELKDLTAALKAIRLELAHEGRTLYISNAGDFAFPVRVEGKVDCR